jgi:hypothetical protein
MLLQKRAQKLEKEFPPYFPQDEKDRLLDMVRTNHMEILFNNEAFNSKYSSTIGNFAYNECLTIDMVLKNLDKDWDYDSLSENPTITFEMILQNKDIIQWNWAYVSANNNITLEMVKEHPELPWDTVNLLENKNIPFSYFEEKMNESFPWYHSVNISIEDIVKHHDVSTDWRMLSVHKNITMKDIEDHPELPWDWYILSGNPNLTIEMVLKHYNEMSWEGISANENITMDIIEKYINYNWIW